MLSGMTTSEAITEVVFGTTRLPRERAGAKDLPRLTRGHWGIENGPRDVRDVTLGGDGSRTRKGPAPQVMTVLRNILIFLFKKWGHKSAPAATRHHVRHPEKCPRPLSSPT